MEQVRTLKIMWLAFMTSIAMFQVVLFMAAAPGEAVELTVLGALAMTATASAGFGVIGVPMVMGKSPANTAFIVRFACYESVALYGFVGAFISGVPAFSLGAAAAAWALLASTFPTDERFTAWEVRRLGDVP